MLFFLVVVWFDIMKQLIVKEGREKVEIDCATVNNQIGLVCSLNGKVISNEPPAINIFMFSVETNI